MKIWRSTFPHSRSFLLILLDFGRLHTAGVTWILLVIANNEWGSFRCFSRSRSKPDYSRQGDCLWFYLFFESCRGWALISCVICLTSKRAEGSWHKGNTGRVSSKAGPRSSKTVICTSVWCLHRVEPELWRQEKEPCCPQPRLRLHHWRGLSGQQPRKDAACAHKQAARKSPFFPEICTIPVSIHQDQSKTTKQPKNTKLACYKHCEVSLTTINTKANK